MTKSYRRRNIGTILVDRGSLLPDQLSIVVGQMGASRQRFGEICIREGFIDEQDLAQALAEQFGLDYIDLGAFKMDEELLNTLPTDAIYRFNFVPMNTSSGVLSVAVSDPTDVVKLDELELLLGCSLRLSIATETAIASLPALRSTTAAIPNSRSRIRGNNARPLPSGKLRSVSTRP